jgi:aryl-alcohol dehydrogenase-like predicted oxidoreductase
LGKALICRCDKIALATKFGQTQQPGGANGVDGSPAYLKAACDASLKRLGAQSRQGRRHRGGRAREGLQAWPDRARLAAGAPDIVPIPGTKRAERVDEKLAALGVTAHAMPKAA